jgi:hypothetical protein
MAALDVKLSEEDIKELRGYAVATELTGGRYPVG